MRKKMGITVENHISKPWEENLIFLLMFPLPPKKQVEYRFFSYSSSTRNISLLQIEKTRSYYIFLLTKSSGWRVFISLFFFSFGPPEQHMEVPQARVRIRAAAAGLHHSYSNTGSEPWPTQQRGQGLNHVFMDISQIHYCWATTGTQKSFHFWCHTKILT